MVWTNDKTLVFIYTALAVAAGLVSPAVPHLAAFLIAVVVFILATGILVRRYVEAKTLVVGHLFLFLALWVITWTIAKGV